MLDKSNMFNNKKYSTIIYVVKDVIRKKSASLPQYAEYAEKGCFLYCKFEKVLSLCYIYTNINLCAQRKV